MRSAHFIFKSIRQFELCGIEKQALGQSSFQAVACVVIMHGASLSLHDNSSSNVDNSNSVLKLVTLIVFVFCFTHQMPEYTRENCAPLGKEFFDSMDRVDEGALARLIVEMQLNTLQDLPDLRTLFFRRKQQQMSYVASQYGRIPAYRVQQQYSSAVHGKPWPMHA